MLWNKELFQYLELASFKIPFPNINGKTEITFLDTFSALKVLSDLILTCMYNKEYHKDTLYMF